jgi:hypothetical protein
MCEVRCKYTPFMNYGLTIGITPTAEVEQHLQQVGIIHNPVTIQVGQVRIRAKRKQHCQQVTAIHAAVAVHIASNSRTDCAPLQQLHPSVHIRTAYRSERTG